MRVTRGDSRAYDNLGIVYGDQGQYEKAAEVTRQAVRLAPDQWAWVRQSRQLHSCLAAFRRNDGRVIHEAQTRKMDDFVFHNSAVPLKVEQIQLYTGLVVRKLVAEVGKPF